MFLNNPILSPDLSFLLFISGAALSTLSDCVMGNLSLYIILCYIFHFSRRHLYVGEAVGVYWCGEAVWVWGKIASCKMCFVLYTFQALYGCI